MLSQIKKEEKKEVKAVSSTNHFQLRKELKRLLPSTDFVVSKNKLIRALHESQEKESVSSINRLTFLCNRQLANNLMEGKHSKDLRINILTSGVFSGKASVIEKAGLFITAIPTDYQGQFFYTIRFAICNSDDRYWVGIDSEGYKAGFFVGNEGRPYWNVPIIFTRRQVTISVVPLISCLTLHGKALPTYYFEILQPIRNKHHQNQLLCDCNRGKYYQIVVLPVSVNFQKDSETMLREYQIHLQKIVESTPRLQPPIDTKKDEKSSLKLPLQFGSHEKKQEETLTKLFKEVGHNLNDLDKEFCDVFTLFLRIHQQFPYWLECFSKEIKYYRVDNEIEPLEELFICFDQVILEYMHFLNEALKKKKTWKKTWKETWEEIREEIILLLQEWVEQCTPTMVRLSAEFRDEIFMLQRDHETHQKYTALFPKRDIQALESIKEEEEREEVKSILTQKYRGNSLFLPTGEKKEESKNPYSDNFKSRSEIFFRASSVG